MKKTAITALVMLVLLYAAAPAYATKDPSGAHGEKAAPAAHETAPGGGHAEEHGSWNLFSVDPGLAIWTVINFAALLLVLRIFAWKPMKKMLDKRSENIEGRIEDAEKMHKDAETDRDEWKKKLENADEEAKEQVDKGIKQGRQERDEILEKARAEAETERKRGSRDAGLLKEKAFADFWEEAADLATGLAGKIAAKSLSPEDHGKLVENFIKEYEESKD